MKLNVLLALRERLGNRYTQLVKDYSAFFRGRQGAFLGTHKTYVPVEGYPVDSSKVANVRVITTVDEKFAWFLKEALEYINTTLSIEASNGQGAPVVPLIFDGVEYGPFPATVLLRLRGIIESDSFHAMLSNVPVREETQVWVPSDDPDYARRGGIFQTERQCGESRTTESHDEVLRDPNLDPAHLPSNYRAQVTSVKRQVKVGDYTFQFFTGQWTHEQRAELLKRRSMLLDAINIALQAVNDREATMIDVTGLMAHLIYGKK